MTKGKNTMNAKDLFSERNKYKFMSGKYTSSTDLLFDSVEKPSYGKVSQAGKTILFNRAGGILSPANTLNVLATIDSENGVEVVDIVAKAFEEMVESMEVKFLRKPGSQVSVYRNITPTRGWEDYATHYRKYLDTIYDKFVSDYFTHHEIKNKIIDVATFIKEFATFQGAISRQIPFLLSSFVRSNNCPPHVSGLVIDLASDDCGNDDIKIRKYLSDINYSSFVRHCSAYGFMLDKNVPWRMYANLKSEHMMSKMKEENVPNIDSFFNTYFNRTETSDFLALIEAYSYIYTKLVNDYPTYTQKKICDKKVVSLVRERQKVATLGKTDLFFAEDERGYPFWIKLYVFTKINENNLSFTQEQMDTLIKSVVSLEANLDIQKALVYTNEVLDEAEVIPASLMKSLRV
jgi:hypothetical protein